MVTDADLLVVGAGPRALTALLALDERCDRTGRTAGTPRHVIVVDPALPGPGAVWDPRQPEHLLMNVNADIVDLRTRLVPHDFRSWARTVGSEMADTPYPPRALVGRHLAWCFERLVASDRLLIEHVRARVTSARRSAGGWTVEFADGGTLRAPDLLLCTGHADSGGIDHRQVMEGTEEGTVVIRGAALTAIDVVLDLTAGRGGQWVESAPGADRVGGLEYRASGLEPEAIVLLNRSGELLVPKPRHLPDALLREVRHVTHPWRTLQRPDDRWWEVLIEAAGAAATSCGVAVSREALGHTLAHGRGPADPWQRWCDDLARAEGSLDDDPAWWLGRAWSAGYRDLVVGLERADRDQSWAVFRERAARLERWAFGPPADTVRRLLALHEAGLLQARTGGTDEPVHHEAVTAPPGIRDATEPLWVDLLASGQVSIRDGERGARTTAQAQCLDAAGAPTPGLWALGRPTEDPVIGHDTLSRTLHRDVEAWARTMAQQGAQPEIQRLTEAGTPRRAASDPHESATAHR